jgi:hypothetical protein
LQVKAECHPNQSFHQKRDSYRSNGELSTFKNKSRPEPQVKHEKKFNPKVTFGEKYIEDMLYRVFTDHVWQTLDDLQDYMVTSVRRLANHIAQDHPSFYRSNSILSDSEEEAKQESLEHFFSLFLSARLRNTMEHCCRLCSTAYASAVLTEMFSRHFYNREPPLSLSSVTDIDRELQDDQFISMSAPPVFNRAGDPIFVETVMTDEDDEGYQTPNDGESNLAIKRVEEELERLQRSYGFDPMDLNNAIQAIPNISASAIDLL